MQKLNAMKNSPLFHINIITLTISHFLWGFVNYTFLIQIQPLLVTIYGTNPKTTQFIGIILSLGALAAVLPLLLSFLADRFGRKLLLISGLLVSIIGLIGLSIEFNNIFITISAIIFFNLGIGLYDPPLQGIIHESVSINRGMAFSIIYNSSSLAGIVASLMIQIQENTDLYFQFFISTIVLAVATTLNLIFLRDIKENIKIINFPIKKIIKERRSQLITFAFVLDAIAWGLSISIANSIYIILFGVDVALIASLAFIETIVIVILQYPAGFTVDRFGRLSGIVIGELSGIGWILFVLLAISIPKNAVELLIVAYIALGVSVAFWRPAVTLSFISIDPSSVSTSFGLLAFFSRLGWVPTAIIGGFIFSIVGFPPLLLITFIGTLFVIIIIIKVDKLENQSSLSPNTN